MTTLINVISKVKVETCPDNSVSFSWDIDDKYVNDIMSKDFTNRWIKSNKKSCMWVKKVMEVADWQLGETLGILTISHEKGCTRAYYYKKDDQRFKDCNITVDGEGFIYMSTEQMYSHRPHAYCYPCTWQYEHVNNKVNIQPHCAYNERLHKEICDVIEVRLRRQYKDLQKNKNLKLP